MKKSILCLVLLLGVANAEYLRDNTKEVVLDSSSNLMWQDNNDADTVTKTWSEALSYCEDLVLGGYEDWRLPNYNELFNLANRSTSNPAISSEFSNVASDDYWSSTSNASDSDNAWGVYFDYGSVAWNVKTNSNYVRCVRAGQ